MREIEFRGLNDYGWHVGHLLISYKDRAYIVTDMIDDDYANVKRSQEVELSTVGQYPGLKDSHGKDVCEGDILEAVFELIDGELETIIDKGVVVFKDYAFQVQTFEDHHEPLHEWAQLSEELKVIGNIYENPELLPGVKTQ